MVGIFATIAEELALEKKTKYLQSQIHFISLSFGKKYIYDDNDCI